MRLMNFVLSNTAYNWGIEQTYERLADEWINFLVFYTTFLYKKMIFLMKVLYYPHLPVARHPNLHS